MSCFHVCKSPLMQPSSGVCFEVSSGAKVHLSWGWDSRLGMQGDQGWQSALTSAPGTGPFCPALAHVCRWSFHPRSQTRGRMQGESERETVGLDGGEARASPLIVRKKNPGKSCGMCPEPPPQPSLPLAGAQGVRSHLGCA